MKTTTMNYKLKKAARGYYKLTNQDYDVRVSKQSIASYDGSQSANTWNIEIQDLNNEDCLTDTHNENFKTKSQCVEFMNYYLNNIELF